MRRQVCGTTDITNITREDRFEWDDRKAASNLKKHKVSFEVARRVFEDRAVLDDKDDSEYHGENRFSATGMVDCDILTVFDRVNHDVLMARLARRIGDKCLLRIIRGFLNAGMMQGGVVIERHEGTPQGGPLSPLLADLLLDDLDKELERRGHGFRRSADDCSIYVASEAAGDRVMASVVAFLEGRLRLKVNRHKSAVAHVEARSFLGHRLLRGGGLGLAPKSLARA